MKRKLLPLAASALLLAGCATSGDRAANRPYTIAKHGNVRLSSGSHAFPELYSVPLVVQNHYMWYGSPTPDQFNWSEWRKLDKQWRDAYRR